MTPDERLVTEVELREAINRASWTLAQEAACRPWALWRRNALRRKAVVLLGHADLLADLLLTDAKTRELAAGG